MTRSLDRRVANFFGPILPHVLVGILRYRVRFLPVRVISENGFAQLEFLGTVPPRSMRQEAVP